MNQPPAEKQIEFLVCLQRLLQEGQFVATYKYALLLSLADIAVEDGDDSGSPLTISTERIAEKFIHYYWRQSAPYSSGSGNFAILLQTTGKQAEVLRLLEAIRREHGETLGQLRRSDSHWRTLNKKVGTIVSKMPLWKLQTVGGYKIDFLYENKQSGSNICLKAGIAYCLRKFHGVVRDLVQSAWVDHVRKSNSAAMGNVSDLHEFLFGSERSSLCELVPILEDVQNGQCFYCRKTLSRGNIHVDHFIPWSRYAIDLGHNFVLADTRCNSDKGARLASMHHFEHWLERNKNENTSLLEGFGQRGISYDLNTSLRVADWAYSQASASSGLTWHKGKEMQPLPTDWRRALNSIY